MSLQLLSILFVLLCGVVVSAVVWLLNGYLVRSARIAAISIFAAWLVYAGVLGFKGVIAHKSPPGLAFLLIPAVLFMALYLARDSGVKQFGQKVPVEWLIGLQSFRVLVEIMLFELFQLHLLPRLMTFEGGNLDILTGLSAPIVAWLYATHKISDRAARAWSWVGIVLLVNAVARAFLTVSGIVHTDIPNLAIGVLPFTFLPGLLVPLALYLHVLLLRSLPRKSSVSV